MREYYNAQLAALNSSIIRMGALCEDAISAAVEGLLTDDSALAGQVAHTELEIDQFERDIERQCMRLLLMQQPVAADLRAVSSALKMISDLERIGDQAYDIADIARHVQFRDFSSKVHIREMAKAVIGMVTDSVDAYVNRDVAAAQKIDKADDRVDALFLTVREELAALIRTNHSDTEQVLDLLMVAKYLERIGDHAVNVSEWVIYAVTGEHV